MGFHRGAWRYSVLVKSACCPKAASFWHRDERALYENRGQDKKSYTPKNPFPHALSVERSVDMIIVSIRNHWEGDYERSRCARPVFLFFIYLSGISPKQ